MPLDLMRKVSDRRIVRPRDSFICCTARYCDFPRTQVTIDIECVSRFAYEKLRDELPTISTFIVEIFLISGRYWIFFIALVSRQ